MPLQTEADVKNDRFVERQRLQKLQDFQTCRLDFRQLARYLKLFFHAFLSKTLVTTRVAANSSNTPSRGIFS